MLILGVMLIVGLNLSWWWLALLIPAQIIRYSILVRR